MCRTARMTDFSQIIDHPQSKIQTKLLLIIHIVMIGNILDDKGEKLTKKFLGIWDVTFLMCQIWEIVGFFNLFIGTILDVSP